MKSDQLSRQQQRLLVQTVQAEGWLITVTPKQANTAMSLERRGLGTYSRWDGEMSFRLNEQGGELARRIRSGT